MLGSNIQTLRKKKGMTQEELAVRLHVVRQTVSKWEKGLSVPDAGTLQKMAEELGCSVSELLGASVEEETDRNELAEQLSRINEQLSVRNRRTAKLLKTAGIVVAAVILLRLILIITGVTLFSFRADRSRFRSCSVLIGQNSEDPVYSTDEIHSAADEAADYFNKNFRDGELYVIRYSQEDCEYQSALWKKAHPEYQEDELITLFVDFRTGRKVPSVTLRTEHDYRDKSWILRRITADKWEVVFCG